MPRISDEEVWYWYEIFVKFKQEKITSISFCEKYNIRYADFHSKYAHIIFWMDSKPELYNKLVLLGRKFKSQPESRERFCALNNVPIKHLSRAVTHLNYLDTIERVKKLKSTEKREDEENNEERDGAKQMSFIQVPVATKEHHLTIQKPPIKHPNESPQAPLILGAPHQELLEKRNDIELTITKGIKVTISPNIESEKIIKIIDLLKDL